MTVLLYRIAFHSMKGTTPPNTPLWLPTQKATNKYHQITSGSNILLAYSQITAIVHAANLDEQFQNTPHEPLPKITIFSFLDLQLTQNPSHANTNIFQKQLDSTSLNPFVASSSNSNLRPQSSIECSAFPTPPDTDLSDDSREPRNRNVGSQLFEDTPLLRESGANHSPCHRSCSGE